MKRLYILLTAIFSISTICMEKEHNIQETESFLQTNSLIKPDKNSLKEKLHTVARDLNRDFDSSKLTTHRSLVNFITHMNQAKRFNIDEHEMAQFAYTLYGYGRHNYTTLYFHCLKKYNNAQEKLPFTIDDLDNEFCIDSKLAQILQISYKYHSMQDIENTITSYPAYTQLITALKTAAHTSSTVFELNHALCNGLHSGVTLLRKYPEYNDVTNFDDFYTNAYALLYPCYANIYFFVALVKHIKTIEKENDEKTMLSKILNYQPQPKEFFGFKYGSSVDVNSVSTSTKNKMALMYRCIEKYHRERGNKITPTSSQNKAFLALKNLDILLPDDFDKTVLDENKYALKECTTLLNNMIIIHNANGDALEQSVKKILQQ